MDFIQTKSENGKVSCINPGGKIIYEVTKRESYMFGESSFYNEREFGAMHLRGVLKTTSAEKSRLAIHRY